MRTKKTDISEDISENEPITSTAPKKTKAEIYEVQKGDTLQSIAVRYKQDWNIVAEANGIAPPYALKIGQKLKLPPVLEV